MTAQLVEVSPSPGVLFKERKDGLLEYCGSTEKPVVVDAWRKLDSAIDEDIWAQGSIAASITTVYGQEDMQELAGGVDKSVQYVRRMAKTYRHFTEKEPRVSFSNIYFKHHTLALRHPEPRVALLKAAENGWTCATFENWIAESKGGKRKREAAFSTLDRSERTEYLKGLRARIQVEQEACPYKEYKGMLADLLEAIEWDIYQLGFAEAERQVKEAIDDHGQRSIKQIVKWTHLKDGEVRKVVGKLVADEEYTWIERRGETQVARGTKELFLEKVAEGTVSHRQTSSYQPVIEYGEPEEHF